MKRRILAAFFTAVLMIGGAAGSCAAAGARFVAHAVRRCDMDGGAPRVSAGRGVLMDADSGELLWERQPDEPGLLASTTKIMTA